MNGKFKKIWISFLLAVSFVICTFFTACNGCGGENETPKELALSASEIHLTVGDDYALLSTVEDVIWTSDDESVAKVDYRGRVSAVGAGTAKIKAKTNEKSVECIVNVTKEAVISTYSVSFTSTQEILKIGDKLTLETQAYKNGEASTEKPTLLSENTSIVTVSEAGEITAVASGKTQIKATYGTASATCTVYVTDGALQFLLSDTSVRLKLGESVDLRATLTVGDEQVETEVTWKSSNQNVTVSADGKITGAFGGEAVVTATANGVSALCQVRVYREKTIATLQEFLAIENDPYVEYTLVNDIDFANYKWTEKTVISNLSSKLDGNGHKLYNINRSVASNHTAFFGEIAQTAEIKNLAFYIDSYAFNANCGVLALRNRGRVQDCYIRLVAKGSSTTYTTLLCCGLVADNYGTMQNLLIDMDVKAGSSNQARFHAIAARNGGTIKDCVVISAATTSVNVTIDGEKVAHTLYQLLSGSNASASNTAYGYASDGVVSNAYDTARGDCLLFDSVENLLSFGNGGYAIYDRTPLVLPTEAESVRITESSVLSRFNGEIWTFANGLVKFHSAVIYGA